MLRSIQKPSLRLCVRRAVMAADVCRMQRPRACSTFRVAHPTRPCQESDLNFESCMYCILVCVLVLSWVLCGTWARRHQRRGLASPSPQYNPNFSNHLHHQSYLAPFRRGVSFCLFFISTGRVRSLRGASPSPQNKGEGFEPNHLFSYYQNKCPLHIGRLQAPVYAPMSSARPAPVIILNQF